MCYFIYFIKQEGESPTLGLNRSLCFFIFLSNIKNCLERIPGSRLSLFIDNPNLEQGPLNSSEGNVEQAVVCSYRGCTH